MSASTRALPFDIDEVYGPTEEAPLRRETHRLETEDNRRVGSKETRVRFLTDFIFVKKGEFVYPHYQSCTEWFWEGVEVYGFMMAATTGVERWFVWSLHWWMDWPGRDMQLVRIDRVVGITKESDLHFRNGNEQVLWLETSQGYSYALMEPDDLYRAGYMAVLLSWRDLGQGGLRPCGPINLDMPPPDWWHNNGKVAGKKAWQMLQKAWKKKKEEDKSDDDEAAGSEHEDRAVRGGKRRRSPASPAQGKAKRRSSGKHHGNVASAGEASSSATLHGKPGGSNEPARADKAPPKKRPRYIDIDEEYIPPSGRVPTSPPSSSSPHGPSSPHPPSPQPIPRSAIPTASPLPTPSAHPPQPSPPPPSCPPPRSRPLPPPTLPRLSTSPGPAAPPDKSHNPSIPHHHSPASQPCLAPQPVPTPSPAGPSPKTASSLAKDRAVREADHGYEPGLATQGANKLPPLTMPGPVAETESKGGECPDAASGQDSDVAQAVAGMSLVGSVVPSRRTTSLGPVSLIPLQEGPQVDEPGSGASMAGLRACAPGAEAGSSEAAEGVVAANAASSRPGPATAAPEPLRHVVKAVTKRNLGEPDADDERSSRRHTRLPHVPAA